MAEENDPAMDDNNTASTEHAGGDDPEAAIDNTGEKTPINNVDNPRVLIEKRSPKTGCYLTRTQIILLVVAILLLVILVGLLAGVLSRRRCPDNEEDADAWRMTTPKPTVNPKLAWSEIRLPRNLIPSHYNITLRVDLDKFVFSGSVEIDVICNKETEYVILHANELDIKESDVSVREYTPRSNSLGTSREVTYHVDVPINQFHVLRMGDRLKKGKRYRIRFGSFKGKILDDLRGLYKSTYKDANGRVRYLAASQLQSVDARKVFPCFDEPDLKANFTVAIEHSPEYTALSNMPVDYKTALSTSWVKDQFQPSPLMSTYLLAFVVADFQERRRTVGGGLEIRIWARREMYEQTSYALDFASEGYTFFANYFDTKEVVPKADHAAIPDFSAGAMENWGLVLYRETALLHDEKESSISNKYWVSLVMAHEIAHTWFGNMVTMKWWDDLWLNEGFANTLMYFALNHVNPHWKVFDLQLVNNIYPVMTKDALLTSHAISTPIIDPDDIPQYFDSISYDKGMAVLRLLRGFLGWDDFKNGLQKYVSKYKFQNAEMSELWDTFAETVNHKYKVGEIMDTWTRQMGFPVVTVKHISGRRYGLVQERFLLNSNDTYDPATSPYKYQWRIPFTYKVQSTGNSRTAAETQTKWIHSSTAEIEVTPGDSWIIGNVDYMGFYRTNYDESMWRRLTEQLKTDHRVFSAANRAGLISDAFNLARANKLSYDIALNLTSYLDKEDDYVPWRAFLDSMDFVKGMLSSSNSYGLLQKFMFDLVAPKYRKVGTSDQGDLLERNLRRVLLQAASGVGVPDAIGWATTAFNDWQAYESRIPPDYAAVVYAVGIQQGTEAEWNHLWEASQRTLVASESEIMMNALAYTQEPWLLWRYARWSLDSSKIRMQDVRNLFRYFASTPLGRSVALQFLLTNWKEINDRFGMDAFLLRDIIHATTQLLNTAYEYNQLERLYQESPPAGVASKAAENSLALISSNIRWVESNHDTIYNWLDRNVGARNTGDQSG